MSDEIINTIKVVLKGENRIIIILKDIAKTDNLANIRKNNEIISPEYKFCDGEDLIDKNIEENYKINDLIDNEGKIYIKSKSRLSNNAEAIEASCASEMSKKFINETKKSNFNKDLIEFINKVSNSKEDLKTKIIQIFEQNFISSLEDLLHLKPKDLEIFNLPQLVKNKLIEEINNLKPKAFLSDDEKKLIQILYTQELSSEIIYESFESNHHKKELIKEYYFSLKKPLKPIPQNLRKLKVNSSKELPCYSLSNSKIIIKKIFYIISYWRSRLRKIFSIRYIY